MMPRHQTTDADSCDYVGCLDCGHPLERHSTKGCDYREEGCTCVERWTLAEIRYERKASGLPVTFHRWNY